MSAGHIDEALSAFENYLALAKSRDNDRQKSVANNRLGDVQTAQGNLAAALENYQMQGLLKSKSSNFSLIVSY